MLLDEFRWKADVFLLQEIKMCQSKSGTSMHTELCELSKLVNCVKVFSSLAYLHGHVTDDKVGILPYEKIMTRLQIH